MFNDQRESSAYDDPFVMEVDVRENRRSMPAQRPGRSKQDYGTPPEFISAVKGLLRIEDFDVDLAAHGANRVTPRYFCPPTEWRENKVAPECRGVDSLVQPWRQGNGWNWLNPPFAHIAPWVERAWTQWTETGARTAVLIPASTGANWWRDHVHRKAKVMLLNGRITFVGTKDPYPKDCALLLYSGHEGYYVWDWKRGKVSV